MAMGLWSTLPWHGPPPPAGAPSNPGQCLAWQFYTMTRRSSKVGLIHAAMWGRYLRHGNLTINCEVWVVALVTAADAADLIQMVVIVEIVLWNGPKMVQLGMVPVLVDSMTITAFWPEEVAMHQPGARGVEFSLLSFSATALIFSPLRLGVPWVPGTTFNSPTLNNHHQQLTKSPQS
ncbi:hypothetical protein BS47DRAFT_1365455 [Hydnum rufescens UP504]|uniref:Uncharacterized protein n=1 Tax=Hydnum rufescens UP504 TaxID=1448309 RepID=A0A9P6ANS7_9AGAM|nr:hypothetical protein BS47DRAFT_1365455 [Hydnum rufescens UP504]